MNSRIKTPMLAAAFVISLMGEYLFAQDNSQPNLIQNMFVNGAKGGMPNLCTLPLVKEFYTKRGFRQIWIQNNRLSDRAKELVEALDASLAEGLTPKLYNIDEIRELMSKLDANSDKVAFAKIELLLTDAFFLCASHLMRGAIDPFILKARTDVQNNEAITLALERAVSSERVGKALFALAPKNKSYQYLKDALSKYRDMASKGGWPPVPQGSKIKLSEKEDRVSAVRARLRLPKKEGEDDKIYDEKLESEVRNFQAQHGIEADGVIGKETVNAMNVSVEERICQMQANLDRMRAMADITEMGEGVFVNIPDFKLEARTNGQISLESNVILGRLKRKTPILSAKIEHIIFNPKWHVPHTILVEDKLPLIKEDPSYARKMRMRLYDEGGQQVDPEIIDWSQIDAENMPYRIVQDSGDFNALGRIKFIFPNRYDVYLHDTPEKNLFKKAVRAFSSGCIRLEKPVELAELFLKGESDWNREKIIAAMKGSYEQVVMLPKAIPIHVIYLTAWVDGKGVVQFRNDIYGYDRIYGAFLSSVVQCQINS